MSRSKRRNSRPSGLKTPQRPQVTLLAGFNTAARAVWASPNTVEAYLGMRNLLDQTILSHAPTEAHFDDLVAGVTETLKAHEDGGEEE